MIRRDTLRLIAALVAALVAAVLAPGCSSCSSRRKAPLEEGDAGVRRRVFRPPPGGVRAVPPHNIHAEGIGPYRLGDDLKDILNLLPHGPRVELFRLGSLADYSLVRTEGGALIVGVERGAGVTFVAAVEGEVARTEGDNGVGASVEDVVEELGASASTPAAVRDPRLLRPARRPEALFLIDDDRVVAVVVDRRERSAPDDGDGDKAVSCVAGPDLEAELESAARLGEEATLRLSCRGGQPREAVALRGDRLAWLDVKEGAAGSRVRRLAATSVEGLRYAAPLVVSEDGEHRVLLAVVEDRTPERLIIRIEALRLESGRLVVVDTHELYELTADAVRMVGGALSQAEVPTEIHAAGRELLARGLFVQRAGNHLSTVVPLEEKKLELDIKRRGGAPARSRIDAGAAPAGDEGDEASSADAGRGRRGIGAP